MPLRRRASACTSPEPGTSSTDPLPTSPQVLADRLRAVGCVYAEAEAALILDTFQDDEEIARVVAGRSAGAPLEHLLGWADFAGLRLTVAPGVFVPRQRSLLLARVAVAALPSGECRVLDLCCGTGALGAYVLARRSDVHLTASDISPVAIACARVNLPTAQVFQGDLFAALPAGSQFDLIIANAPYVPTSQVRLLPVEAREYEELGALDGGEDGGEPARRIVAHSPGYLSPGGSLLIETASHDAEPLVRTMERAGLVARLHSDDDLSATVVLGRADSANSHLRS